MVQITERAIGKVKGILGTHDLLHLADRSFGYLHHVVFLLLNFRDFLAPIIPVDHITPTANHLDGAVWGLVAEKSTLNRAAGGIGGRPGPGRAGRAILQGVSAETR